MNQKICLLIATKMEADEIIKNMLFVENKPLPYYFDDRFELVITGMGHQLNLDELKFIQSLQSKQYWNLGICGCLNDGLELFQLCMPSLLFLENRDLVECPTLICNQNLISQKISLMTLQEPLHGGAKRDKLLQIVDLVDMEAYYLVSAFQKVGLYCNVLKCISDFCLPNGSDNIKKNLPKASFVLRTSLDFIVNSAKT